MAIDITIWGWFGISSAHQNDDLKGGLWLGFTWFYHIHYLDSCGKAESSYPSGKLPHNYGKSPILMGKLTMSMAIFNSKLLT